MRIFSRRICSTSAMMFGDCRGCRPPHEMSRLESAPGIVRHPLIDSGAESNYFRCNVVDQDRPIDASRVQILQEGCRRLAEVSNLIKVGLLLFQQRQRLGLEHLQRLDVNMAVGDHELSGEVEPYPTTDIDCNSKTSMACIGFLGGSHFAAHSKGCRSRSMWRGCTIPKPSSASRQILGDAQGDARRGHLTARSCASGVRHVPSSLQASWAPMCRMRS